jgi:hypothetical protein
MHRQTSSQLGHLPARPLTLPLQGGGGNGAAKKGVQGPFIFNPYEAKRQAMADGQADAAVPEWVGGAGRWALGAGCAAGAASAARCLAPPLLRAAWWHLRGGSSTAELRRRVLPRLARRWLATSRA